MRISTPRSIDAIISLERCVARLDVEVRHAIDRRTVPAARARVCDAAAGPTRSCEMRAAERPLEHAVAISHTFSARVAVVVEGVARELLGDASGRR